ncbi:hypothetical protein [Blattabacterium cuenoti]|uniref:hypothetical protein n=1 Tax=Blattabacterium cuenoti TaxID=1653831 RepID=UPI00163D1DFC|nr:hypothetical protein [Blattabacterium cuenoti]
MKKHTKIVLFLILLIGSIYFFFQKNYFFGGILVLLSGIPIFLIFRNEFLLLAFLKIQKKDMKGLKKCLESVKDPKLQLTKSQISYYYFLNGICYSELDIRKSENYMQKALDFGLKFKHNIAIAKLNLAIASLSKGDKKKAEILLSEAKKTDVTGLLHDHIQIIKKKIKRTNNISRNNRRKNHFY